LGVGARARLRLRAGVGVRVRVRARARVGVGVRVSVPMGAPMRNVKITRSCARSRNCGGLGAGVVGTVVGVGG